MKNGEVVSKTVTDAGMVAVDVQTDRAGVTHTCAVTKQFSGAYQNIEQGDFVAIDQFDDGRWVMLGILNTDESNAPTSMEGNTRKMHFDDGTEISVEKTGSGYDVSIEATGNVTINASGDVTIGDSTNAAKLAVQEHTHTYTDSDGNNGTTSKPNESGTATKVE